MPENAQPKIEKPWAVYGWWGGSWGIGKIIVERKNSVDIKYHEVQFYPAECWDTKWVERFDDPVRAMAYFKIYNREDYSKGEILERFLTSFPEERMSLARRLPKRFPPLSDLERLNRGIIEFLEGLGQSAQSQPKLTKPVRRIDSTIPGYSALED